MSAPVVLCILDGVGWGRRDDGDAWHLADTPILDGLLERAPWCLLAAHGTAVGLPSDGDMGNSEVGHNAMGAGRVFDQGAKLVDKAIASGAIWESPAWREIEGALHAGGTLHLLGLLSDGNVHSHVRHLDALIARGIASGARRLCVHALTDGRDVAARSALRWVPELEARLAAAPIPAGIATGGGRMHITMDRYEADWEMVARGWRCHVRGEGRRFPSATAAIEAAYAEHPDRNDQWLPAFTVGDYSGMAERDAVVLFNFRGDRAIEISRAFDEGPAFDRVCFDRGRRPAVTFAGMMEYDGDLSIPRRYLVTPPEIDRTVGEQLSAAGRSVFALSETQKFGHVTFFFNGNRSDPPSGETRHEVPSDNLPFDSAPAMKADEITDAACAALAHGDVDHLRLNIANGDMVGHTGNLSAVVQAMGVVDTCVGRLVEATHAAGGVLLITADHGNCEEMFRLDRKKGRYARDDADVLLPSTSHSLNPVPFILVDPSGTWRLADADRSRPVGSIARIGATLLTLCDVPIPPDYLPALVTRLTD